MLIKGILDDDFVNYRLPAMVIEFPKCSWKCGAKFCQNTLLTDLPDINISYSDIVQRYLNNDITKSIIFMGLEPFESAHDVFMLVEEFRKYIDDDIVIYTGYYESEISRYIEYLKKFKNIIIKFGRYKPYQLPHYDEVLGIKLASNNQYAVKIS